MSCLADIPVGAPPVHLEATQEHKKQRRISISKQPGAACPAQLGLPAKTGEVKGGKSLLNCSSAVPDPEHVPSLLQSSVISADTADSALGQNKWKRLEVLGK